MGVFSEAGADPVIILAGGRGTRLGALTGETPKPMLRIDGRPFLEYVLLQLRRYGFHRFVLATGYLGTQVQEYVGSGDQLGIDVRYSQEDAPLGTAGALRKALIVANAERCLVVNGDSFLDTDPRPVLDAVTENVVVALAATQDVADDRYGRILISASGVVEAFLPAGRNVPGLVNAGIYGISRRLLDWIPTSGPSSLEHDVLPALVAKGYVVAVGRSGFFIDIGIPAAYDGLVAAPAPLLAAAGIEH